MRRVELGAGEPAVVLEAGLNNGAAPWQRVMPLLAPHVRVAAYDRAGPAAADKTALTRTPPRNRSGTTLLTVKPVASGATNGFRTALRRDAAKRLHPS